MTFEDYKKEKNDEYIYKDIKPKFDNNVLKGYDSAYDVEAVKQSLMNLFLVSKSEVPGKPDVGNTLNMSLFEIIDDFTLKSIRAEIETTIAKYEPRVIIDDLKVDFFEDLHRIVITINFYVIIDNKKIYESIYLPFAYNDKTFIASRTLIEV
jgi:phage baseplate assembly protein W